MSYDPTYNVLPLQRLAESLGIHSDYLDKSLIVGDDETEPKVEVTGRHRDQLNDQQYFDAILRYLEDRTDIILVPGSYRDDKSPMVNVMMDTNQTIRSNVAPSLEFFQAGQELRFRGELQVPEASQAQLKLLKRDWTNKTVGGKGKIKGIDGNARDELDVALHDGPRAIVGYKNLARRAKEAGTYLAADVPYQDLRVTGGYPTVRNTYAFALETQILGQPVFLVIEPCEDRWSTFGNRFTPTIDQGAGLNYIKQFEFELKGVIGLPETLGDQETKNRVKKAIREKLFALRDDICCDVEGFAPTDNSKSSFATHRLPNLNFYGPALAEELTSTVAAFRVQAQGRGQMAKNGLIVAAHTGLMLSDALQKHGENVIDIALAMHNRREDARDHAYANRIEGFRAPKGP